MMTRNGWQPTPWFRIETPGGALWMETSDQAEAEAEADRTGWKLERLWTKVSHEWRQE
jgi:hypothetical protein